MLAKEPLLFALPAVVLWPSARPLGLAARLRASAPALAAGASYLLLRAVVLHGVAGLDPSGERLRGLLNAPALLLDGALNALVPIAIYPRALNEDYAALGMLGRGLCALALLVLALAIWRMRARVPLLAWSAFWFACTLAPAALVTGAMWPGFGRHLFLPLSLGLVGVVDLGARVAERLVPHLRSPKLLSWALWAYLGLLALRIHGATYDWADEPTLFKTMIAEAPGRSLGYGMLGITYSVRHRYPEAVPLLAHALELAPNERRWASRLGTALLFSGRRADALQLATAWIAKLPAAPEFHLLAAYATLDSDPEASAIHVLECLKQDPGHSQCREALQFIRSHPRPLAKPKVLAR
jgi:tetratricopeptide (TPR) repeat protein